MCVLLLVNITDVFVAVADVSVCWTQLWHM